eukprot:6192554-Pleurochrysis_carterae.AAC.1
MARRSKMAHETKGSNTRIDSIFVAAGLEGGSPKILTSIMLPFLPRSVHRAPAIFRAFRADVFECARHDVSSVRPASLTDIWNTTTTVYPWLGFAQLPQRTFLIRSN